MSFVIPGRIIEAGFPLGSYQPGVGGGESMGKLETEVLSG